MSTPGGPLRPEQINPLQNIQAPEEIEQGSTNNFASMMEQTSGKQVGTSSPSPLNILTGTNGVSGPSYETMQAQLNLSQSRISDMQTQLNTPNLKIKPEDMNRLGQYLNNANGHLGAVHTKLGLQPPQTTPPSSGPLGKFLGLLNSGSEQIASAKDELNNIASTPNALNPAQMLLVQVKINQAQQQIEFSSILLSKVVDDFKQLMNIQI